MILTDKLVKPHTLDGDILKITPWQEYGPNSDTWAINQLALEKFRSRGGKRIVFCDHLGNNHIGPLDILEALAIMRKWELRKPSPRSRFGGHFWLLEPNSTRANQLTKIMRHGQ